MDWKRVEQHGGLSFAVSDITRMSAGMEIVLRINKSFVTAKIQCGIHSKCEYCSHNFIFSACIHIFMVGAKYRVDHYGLKCAEF